MYNEGEPHFWKGERDPGYQAKYLKHLDEVGGIP
jgi:hypothetical protein